jgi:radical SAM superfamily enzyme YgiQ (UPF0313 family)
MRVAIIATPYPLNECPAPPLGVTYVAAAFESSGADVRIIDYIVSRYSPGKLNAALDEFKPAVVGLTSVTMNFPIAVQMVSVIKEYDPSIITIMGGPHVSFDAENTLCRYPDIDLVVMGEGEKTITDLMSCGMDPKQWPFIQGIAFRCNGKVMNTGFREFIEDVDSLPLPARHLLHHSRYQALGYPISIVTGRGCPYSCIFCLGRKMVGKKVRRRKASLVVDEIEDILSYGWNRINFADDLFTSDRRSVQDICGEIRRRGLKFAWSAFARVNTVDKMTLELMKTSGCDSVSFGIESGNREMLQRIRKGITLTQVRNAIRLCREAGIIAHASFMVGLPGESPRTLRETREFARSLEIMYGYHFLAPFPGTVVREYINDYDLEILTNDWSRYDANSAIVKTSSVSPEELEQFVAEYDEEMNAFWAKAVNSYREGTNESEDNLRVEGHFKAQLVHKMLSEDIIESWGTFPMTASHNARQSMIEALCGRIMKTTGMDEDLIKNTLQYLIHAGYLNSRAREGNIIWEWNRNKEGDF